MLDHLSHLGISQFSAGNRLDCLPGQVCLDKSAEDDTVGSQLITASFQAQQPEPQRHPQGKCAESNRLTQDDCHGADPDHVISRLSDVKARVVAPSWQSHAQNGRIMPESVECTNKSGLVECDSVTSDDFNEIYRAALAPSSPLACYLDYSADFHDPDADNERLGIVHDKGARHVAVTGNKARAVDIDLGVSRSHTKLDSGLGSIVDLVKDTTRSQPSSDSDLVVEVNHSHDNACPAHDFLTSPNSCRDPVKQLLAVPVSTSRRIQSAPGSASSHDIRLPKSGAVEDRTFDMDDVEHHPRHSNGSTLSTTQENDPSVYEQYQRYDEDEDEESEDGETGHHVTHNLRHEPESQTSPSHAGHGISGSRTDPSYAPGETGCVEFHFDTPIQESNVRGLARSEHASTSPVENEGEGRGSNPKTPGLPKPFFARPDNLLGGSQLFGMTQITPGNALLSGPPIPSSSRPSPSMYDIGLESNNPVSSPLISRGRSHMEESTAKVVYSSPADQSQDPFGGGHNHPFEADSSNMVDFDKMPAASSRGAIITKATYVTRKASQEERQRKRHERPVNQLSSSDEEFSDYELRQRLLVKKRRELGSRTLASARLCMATISSAASLVEVPSTATRRRRSDLEDGSAENTRQTQDGSAIADSQGPYDKEEMDTNIQALKVQNSSRSLSTDSLVDTAAQIEMKDGIDEDGDEVMPALDPGLGSLSTSSERAPSPPLNNKHSRIEGSSCGAAPSALGTQKDRSSKDIDITILETSPPLPCRSTFLGVPIDSSAADLLDAEFLEPSQPQYDADLEDAVFGSSSPIRPNVAKRRFGRGLQNQPQLSSARGLNTKEQQSPLGQEQSPQKSARPTKASPTHATIDKETSWRNSDYATAHEPEEAGVALSPQSSDLSTVHLSDFDEIEMSFAQNMASVAHGRPSDSSQSSGSTQDENLIVESKEALVFKRGVDTDLAQSTTEKVTRTSCSLRSVPIPARATENVQMTSAIHETAPVVQAFSSPHQTTETTTEKVRVTSKVDVPLPTTTDLTSAQQNPQWKPSYGSVLTRSATRLSATAPPVTHSHRTSKDENLGPFSSPLGTQLSNRAVRALAKCESRELTGQHTARASTSSLASTIRPASTSGARSRHRYSESEDELADNDASHQDMVSITRHLGKSLQTSGSAQLASVSKESRIFRNMAFAVSYSKNDSHKSTLIHHIKANGGLLLEDGFEELFAATSSAPNTPRSKALPTIDLSRESLALTAQAKSLGFVCLIADHHSRKAKFMQALALDLPCLSGLWVRHCVHAGVVLDWGPYLLAAGESVFLDGAIRSRSLQIYPAVGHQFSDIFNSRAKMLDGKAIILVMGKGKAEERKRAYYFLTQALGARRVKRVLNSDEARKCLSEAATNGDHWDWVYVDEDPVKAEHSIFGEGVRSTQNRKRKKPTGADDGLIENPGKRARIVGDEYVIQSLILGRLLDEHGERLADTT